MHREGTCNNIAVTGDTVYFSNTYHERHPCCLVSIPFTYVVSNPIGQKPSGYISQKLWIQFLNKCLYSGTERRLCTVNFLDYATFSLETQVQRLYFSNHSTN